MDSQPKVSIPVSEEVFQRVALLKAKMSACEGRVLDWDQYFELQMQKERSKQEILSWLYTLAIFAGITFILTFMFFRAHPVFLPLFLVIGAVVAAASTYVLVPWSLRTLKPFTNAPPEIEEAVEQLSRKAGIKKRPQLILVEANEVNAMTYPTLAGDRILLTKGILESYQTGYLSLDELRAILAHEMGHIIHRDCFRHSLMLSWVSIFDKIGNSAVYAGSVLCGIAVAIDESSEEEDNPSWVAAFGGWSMVVGGYLMKIIAKAASLPAFHHSRRQELAADEVGAELVSPKNMADALRKLQELQEKLVAKALASLPYAERWQAEPANPSWLDKLYDTHPPLDERQRTLRQIDTFLQPSQV